MQVASKYRVGPAVTGQSAATSLPAAIVAYADVSAWQQAVTPNFMQGDLQVEVQVTGSTTIAAADVYLWGMYLEDLVISPAEVTSTHGSDIINYTSHPFLRGDKVRFRSTLTVPAGLTADTDYYVIPNNANSFKLAQTRALAFAGTAINTTGDGTGTITVYGLQSTRATWAQVGALGYDSANPGDFALGVGYGHIKVLPHNPRIVGYALVGTLDTGNVTVKFRPVATLQ